MKHHESERDAEDLLRRLVAAVGGLSLKLVPSLTGMPDRLIVLPPGQLAFVELKAPGGRVSPAQAHVHARLRRLGADVHVLRGTADVREYVRTTLDTTHDAEHPSADFDIPRRTKRDPVGPTRTPVRAPR